jgi:hypothetical protein
LNTIIAARLRAFFVTAVLLTLSLPFAESAHTAGALAVGQCGAYGQAFDFAGQASATAAAKKQCQGDCTTVSMTRSCAAFAVDMKNPCGAHAYAVAPKISASLNAATKKCYEFGGKECVIRAWACDAKG